MGSSGPVLTGSLRREPQVYLLQDKKTRLSSGLIKLRATQEEVAILEEDLQEKAGAAPATPARVQVASRESFDLDKVRLRLFNE